METDSAPRPGIASQSADHDRKLLPESLLAEKGIMLPSADREGRPEEACLYGSEYYALEVGEGMGLTAAPRDKKGGSAGKNTGGTGSFGLNRRGASVEWRLEADKRETSVNAREPTGEKAACRKRSLED
jgi:hypothetical protein